MRNRKFTVTLYHIVRTKDRMQTYSYTDTGFYAFVNSLKSYYKRLWNASSGGFPKLHEHFTPEQQRQKEKELDCIIAQASSSLANDSTGNDPIRFHHIKNIVRNSLINSVGLFHCTFDEQTQKEFSLSTDDFISEAKKFNPELSSDDIYQALRNVWIVNSIQVYLNQKVAMTPSCFAYSMLYPYTDNTLDAPEIDRETKRRLNQRLALRLAGMPVSITNNLERDMYKLFEMIEKEFDRATYPHVYESLLAIHHAQTRSVSQQSTNRRPSSHELLDISIEKGGTSVLADGYLIKGDLSAEDAEFLFGYGVFLQIIDDLQDLQSDLDDHQTTIIGDASGREFLDEITNRLITFMYRTLALARRTRFHEQGSLRELIERSCLILVLEAIARHHTYYTPDYVSAMEKYSPVRFEYFRQTKNHLRQLGNNLPGRQPIPPSVRLSERVLRRVCPGFVET